MAVDTARTRCPEIDPRVVQVFSEPFAAPPPSKPLASGKSGLDDDDKRVWLDRAEGQHQRTTGTGRSLVASYNACRTGGGETIVAGK